MMTTYQNYFSLKTPLTEELLDSNGLLFVNMACRISETSIPLCKMYCDSKTISGKRKIGLLPDTSVLTTGFQNFRVIERVDN